MLGKKLKKGDTIGLICPAGPENHESIKRGIAYLNKLGFKTKEGKHIYDKLGYLCGTDEDRANDLMNMFLDTDVDMILCIRGGYGTMRILPLINFDIIKNNPKIFAGFSDITTLLNNFSEKCDLTTFHSPMGTSNLSDEDTFYSFFKTLTEGDKPYIIENPSIISLESNSDECVTGKLVGGNLCLICSTLGTPFEINIEDNILFIEDVGEEPYRVDRMLTQLILSEKLEKARGIILGQFTNCTLPHYERSLTLEEVIQDRLLKLNKPIMRNLQSGHSYPKLTLPIGANIKMDCKNKRIEVLDPVVN